MSKIKKRIADLAELYGGGHINHHDLINDLYECYTGKQKCKNLLRCDSCNWEGELSEAKDRECPECGDDVTLFRDMENEHQD